MTTLIEVHQRQNKDREPFVTDVELPIGEAKSELLQRLAPRGYELCGLRAAKNNGAAITIGGRRLDVRGIA